MIPPFGKTLSRRKFLALTGGLTGALLAACSDGSDEPDDSDSNETEPTPTSESRPEPTATATAEPSPTATATPEPTPTPEPESPVRYWITPELEDRDVALLNRVIDAVSRAAVEAGLDVEQVSERDDADVSIVPPEEEDDQALEAYGEPMIPVAAPDQLASELSQDQVASLFDGSVENWIEVDGHDRPVVRAIHPALASAGFTEDALVASSDEVARFVADEPGAVALIPRSMASFHVQSLVVDGVDPLRDELTPESWPSWSRISMLVDGFADESFRERLSEEIDEINTSASTSRRTMLSVVGDVMLGRTVHTIMTQRDDWRAPYPLVADELQRGDLTIGNLECAITGSFSPPEDPMTFSFMTFPEAAEGLEFAGFAALSGANNHAMDFGVAGVLDTRTALADRGIEHFGAGTNLDEARQPCLLEHEGITFALLGYDAISMNYAGATAETGGVSPMIREYVVEDIQRAREHADVVIPYFHWGVEYTLTPTGGDREMAHAAIDAGADLVLGGHPHWVQGMEIYEGRPIFYSLANFVFDQEWSLETKQGLVLHLIFDGTTLVGYRVVPVLIEEFYRPRIVEDDMRATILGRYWESTSIIANQ